ncbi:GNAT superfamily N-acetyltransferase [Clostridium punense]|uniref:GNAT superfamily N-acetyltransferase n=1 Tax=Clostridium punense TaxID=1054297 RepID=A0ABS4K8U0_9CLOT|nr:GNAT family N-acetyltransferase [Clostridium sp. BL8]EQB88440.1 GCN5 family acetyltransferase [Clostridium sp. BL8]MBP2024198.1 GNAT superfamily N-acetyltransferase [Clostridium punense]
MKVEFSVAEEKELQEIINIFNDAIEEMNKHNILQWDEVYPDKNTIENDIRNKELYVGKIHSEIACVYAVNDECHEEYINGNWKYPKATYAVIHRMCVNPKFQNQGIGILTLNHISEKLKSEGVETIRLDAFSLNPFALKMYYKNGYVKVGEANWRKGKFYLMEKKL